jgi:hypothetical protein
VVDVAIGAEWLPEEHLPAEAFIRELMVVEISEAAYRSGSLRARE